MAGTGPIGSEWHLDGDSFLLAPADRAGTRAYVSRLDPYLTPVAALIVR